MTEASRKDRILGVAERLFAHYGPSKTTIADIARGCGIGVGSVYLDFSSKEAILAALSQKNVNTVASRMKAAAPVGPAPDRLVAMLEARVVALFDLADGGQHGCDLLRCAPHGGHESGRGSRGQTSESYGFGVEVRSVLLAEVEQGVASGQLRRSNATEVVALVEVAFAALSPPALFRLDREEAVATARRLAHLVVYGLHPPETFRAGPQPRSVK